jgi:hypothetical protein
MSENIPDALMHEVAAVTKHVERPRPEDDAEEREPSAEQAAERGPLPHADRTDRPSTGGSDRLHETNGGG